MDKVLADFENLKISAFSKYSKLTGDINNVTIGPNSTIVQSTTLEPETTLQKETEKSSVKKDESLTSPIALAHVLKEFESQRREKVQEAIQDHYHKFENFSKKQKSEQEKEWFLKQQAFIQRINQCEEMIIQILNQQDVDKSRQHDQLIKHYQDMTKRKMLYEQQLEKHKEKQRIMNENIEKIRKYQVEFRTTYQELIISIKSCQAGEQLRKQLGDNFKLLKTLPESFDEIITKCKTYNINEELLAKSANLLIQLRNLKVQVEEIVGKINTRKKEEAIKAQVQAQAQAQAQQQAEAQLKSAVNKPVTENVPTVKNWNLSQCVSPQNLKKYAELKQFLSQYSELFKELVNDDQLKQFRFDCKKAVNIPVNAISAVSTEHMRDKYMKLNNLLSGKDVPIADKQINASRHPQGVPFCMDLLAKKFVLQGDLMISSNPESAFCYATIIISLWNDFPEFGKLLLGYFYTQCPYLVPFYIPKTEDQSTEDYYVSLGYRYVDGQIEKQDKFLKRMTGILRLYFAIMIAKPKRGQLKNPHDIKNAWNFLVSILKLDPQLDITATTLHIFLEVVGHEMEVVYGSAFKKLVRIIIEKFIPVLKNIDTGGPVTRLEVLLQDYKQKGCFEKPNGVLTMNFW